MKLQTIETWLDYATYSFELIIRLTTALQMSLITNNSLFQDCASADSQAEQKI